MTARRARKGLAALAAASVVVSGCGGGDATSEAGIGPAPTPRPAAATPTPWPAPAAYEPDAAEEYANGKRLASRAALEALTYPRGASPAEVAARVAGSGQDRRALARVLDPAVDGAMESRAEIVYPQLSGVTPSSLGAMVIVRQRLTSADGRSHTVNRVLDVRLRRSGGPWRLDRIASVGGTPAARPRDLGPGARAVVDNPRITLSDSARWDIYAGRVDAALLEALARMAQQHRISVGILRNGHPERVWETTRVSAHSRGAAADIYAVDGRLVLRQREAGTPAYALAASLVSGGAAQVGSPWQLGADPSRSFTDAVHQDHVHVQWSASA